jgi:Rrf2 family protein
MIGLSKRTDYALLALTYLGRDGHRAPVRAKSIAEEYEIPVELLAKILQRLSKAGLVSASPGPTGGYLLTRSPREVSIGDVVSAVEGSPALIQCERTSGGGCEQRAKCTIRRPLTRIQTRVYQLLNRITLNEIAGEEPEPVDDIVPISAIRRRPIAPLAARTNQGIQRT